MVLTCEKTPVGISRLRLGSGGMGLNPEWALSAFQDAPYPLAQDPFLALDSPNSHSVAWGPATLGKA